MDIQGYDISENAIKAAMENARNAESVKKKINKIMIYESVY